MKSEARAANLPLPASSIGHQSVAALARPGKKLSVRGCGEATVMMSDYRGASDEAIELTSGIGGRRSGVKMDFHFATEAGGTGLAAHMQKVSKQQ